VGTQFVVTEQRGPVRWIFFNDFMETLAGADKSTVDVHTAIGQAMLDARYDDSVRLIVLTGSSDVFYTVPTKEYYSIPGNNERVNPMKRPGGFAHPPRPDVIEILSFMEKPVIARVNGDVIGFGQSVLWGCDIIVAVASAVIADVHTGQGDVVGSNGVNIGFPQAITPGDGAMAFFPLFMPPTKLKEYMLLSKGYTAVELAEMGIVNYAFGSMAEVDAKVDELVERLLSRQDYALQHTKRVCNKHLINQLNLAKDAAAAMEVNDLWQHGKDGTM
jgi:enoyl-CoA hydratase/carnithine racemase